MSGEVESDFINILNTKWVLDNKPLISSGYDYLSIDTSHTESILFQSLGENDDFLGIGGNDYKRSYTFIIAVRTSGNRFRMRQLIGEVRRILRDSSNWGDYINVKIVHYSDLIERQRKMSEVDMTVTAWRAESI